MQDINGKELKTGQIVEIKNAYFKNDNGLYFIDHSPEDIRSTWIGKDYSLKRVCKNGKISKARNSLCSWPIAVYVNDPVKSCEAKSWNKDNATIEVVERINNNYVKAHFLEESQKLAEQAKWHAQRFGEDDKTAIAKLSASDFYQKIAVGI